jgi:hypothetical protein
MASGEKRSDSQNVRSRDAITMCHDVPRTTMGVGACSHFWAAPRPWSAGFHREPCRQLFLSGCEHLEDYAKLSLQKYRPMAALNDDRNVSNGLL